jgi:hypothetical protein
MIAPPGDLDGVTCFEIEIGRNSLSAGHDHLSGGGAVRTRTSSSGRNSTPTFLEGALESTDGGRIRPLPLHFEAIDHVGGDRGGARQLIERPAQQGAGRAALSGGDHGSEVPGLANLRRDFTTFTKHAPRV